MKVKKLKLREPLMLAGHVRSEDTLSEKTHKGIEMEHTAPGVYLRIGEHEVFIPNSSIRWIELEPREK